MSPQRKTSESAPETCGGANIILRSPLGSPGACVSLCFNAKGYRTNERSFETFHASEIEVEGTRSVKGPSAGDAEVKDPRLLSDR